MKKLLLIFSILWISVQVNAGKVVTDSLSSKILDSKIMFNVYLPDGFDECDKSYPVVYLLHGLSDNHTRWKEWGRMELVADELIASGEADEMVIIMPQAGDSDVRNVQCGYFNVENWNYEDFFFRELIPSVEKKYRGIGDKAHRAIMGLSMGGGGSTVYCQRHPDMFSSCYAMSAWLENKTNQVGSDGSTKDKLYIVCKSVSDNSALDFLDRADAETVESLRSVAWFFDCGDDDFLLQSTMDMHMKMREKGIKDELRVRNGVHNWEYWHQALRIALPFASRNFGK
ncbi:MAG: alpha/beta fold hydrolase [Alistipes sp.]|nr:alpha/beta fold hydrolase [Candidatus Minthomonas equi]